MTHIYISFGILGALLLGYGFLLELTMKRLSRLECMVERMFDVVADQMAEGRLDGYEDDDSCEYEDGLMEIEE